MQVCVCSIPGRGAKILHNAWPESRAKTEVMLQQIYKTLKMVHIQKRKIYIYIYQAFPHENQCYFLPKHS